MFNFNGPPRYLTNPAPHPSSSGPNKSRLSVSDVGLNNLRRDQLQNHHHQASMPNSTHSSYPRGPPISLPPITKTKSLTLAPTTRHHSNNNTLGRPPPAQPKKRPSHREMITLTLTHVQSVRGLTFDQLSSFIRGAFDLPKTSALDSKLGKTLSNMVSRGQCVKVRLTLPKTTPQSSFKNGTFSR